MNYKLTNNPDLIIELPATAIPKASQKWQEYQDWLAAGNTPEPADSPEPVIVEDWAGFNAAFLSNADWLAIAPQFSTPDIRTGIVSAAATANAGALQIAYGLAIADLTAQAFTVDETILMSWQEIANAHNIPVTFIA